MWWWQLMWSLFYLSPFSLQRWLGAGGTLLPISHHIPDHGRHQRQAKQHLWWPHWLWHCVIPGRAREEADSEEVLLWPCCRVRTQMLLFSSTYLLLSFWDFLVKLWFSSLPVQVAVVLLAGPAQSGWSQLLFSKRLWKGESHGHHIIQTDL